MPPSSAPIPDALANVSAPPPIHSVLDGLTKAGHRAYLVGGCVRDLLRGKTPKDYDVATSALPGEVQRAFKKVIPTGIEHGTVTVVVGKDHVEVTTFRSEGPYLDARRPSSVRFEQDVDDDLSRRDFTINAMAFDPIGRDFRDPFEGQRDLEAKLIRCVGRAIDRFTEDGLRPLRAVRFAAVLGFEIEASTLEAIPAVLDSFRKVARERIKDELQKLLVSASPSRGVALLHETALLGCFLPELVPHAAASARALAATTPQTPLEEKLALFLHPLGADAAKAALLALKFPNKTAEDASLLLRHQPRAPLEGKPDADVRRFLAAADPARLEGILSVARALHDAGLVVHENLDAFAARARSIRDVNPPLFAKQLCLNGGDLMRLLGTGPSPIIGEAARYLLDQVLDDPTLNSPDRLAQTLEKWMGSRRT